MSTSTCPFPSSFSQRQLSAELEYNTTTKTLRMHTVRYTESAHHHKDLSCCPRQSHPLLTCPHPCFKSSGTTDLFSISIVLSFQGCYTNGIMQYATFFFSDWLFPQSIILWRFIQVVLQSNSLFIASWYGYTFVSLIIYLLKDFWVVSCLELSSKQSCYKNLCIGFCKHAFFLCEKKNVPRV